MATVFELWAFGPGARDVDQAAMAVFELIDQLEQELSYFIPCSDVSRINRLKAGESVRVGAAAFECIELARRVHAWTGGAFDPTVGAMLTGRRPWDEQERAQAHDASEHDGDAGGPVHVGMSLVETNRRWMAVGVLTDHVAIDLGGIGKGYALDEAGAMLRDWGIESVMLSAGRSTMLPIGLPPGGGAWTMRLIDPRDERTELGRFDVEEGAVSVSAASAGAPHILNPSTGEPALSRLGAWAWARSAARADALSTAFMVMPTGEISGAARAAGGCAMLLSESEGDRLSLEAFGVWKRLCCGLGG